MSSISSVSSSNFSLSQITQVASRQIGSTNEAGAPPPPPRGGGLFDAIAKTLAQLGVTDSSTSSDDSSGSGSTASTDAAATDAASAETSAAQALGSFIQSLLAALHGQSDAQGTEDGDANDSAPTDGIAATGGKRPPPPPGGGHGPGGPGGPGKLEADLQSLIAELDSATAGTDSTTSSTGTAGTSTAGTTSDGTALENSFKNLLSALGNSSSTTKLSEFLSTLAANLQNGAPTGNVVNTQA